MKLSLKSADLLGKGWGVRRGSNFSEGAVLKRCYRRLGTTPLFTVSASSFRKALTIDNSGAESGSITPHITLLNKLNSKSSIIYT